MAKYLKRDSDLGYIQDSAKIEYLKLNNLRHSILGCMLGDFDEQGYYVVSAEIQKELLSMKKFLVKTMDNIEICRGEVMLNKPITFMVTFEADRATLSLVERLSFEANLEIDSGTYSNVNEFILDEVETAGEIDHNKIYKMWNIYPMGGDVLDITKMDEETLALYMGIANRYKYLLFANKMMLEKEKELEEIEAEYSLNMLNILKKYPKFKDLVDAEIKTDLKDKKEFIRIDKPNFAKTFNEVLDQAIEGNNNALTEEEASAFEQESRAVLQARNIAMQDKLDIKTQTALEEESNQTELDDEMQDARSFKKIELDTKGQENNWSIEDLFNEFFAIEQKVTAERIANAIEVTAGIDRGIPAGARSKDNDLIAQVSENYADVNDLVGEETATQINATTGKTIEVVNKQANAAGTTTGQQSKTTPSSPKPVKDDKKSNNASNGTGRRNGSTQKKKDKERVVKSNNSTSTNNRYTGSTGSGGMISDMTRPAANYDGAEPAGKAGETKNNEASATAEAEGKYKPITYNLGVEYGEEYVAGSTSVNPSTADDTLNP